MSQHTPGPSYQISARWAGSRFCGCRVTRDGCNRPVVEECALHASAPRLLGRLAELEAWVRCALQSGLHAPVSFIDEGSMLVDLARDAIREGTRKSP